MTSCVSMIKKLEPLGIYNTQNGSNISYELQAYALALDEHRNNIETVLKECFINTAGDYGIEIREKMIGSLRDRYPYIKRRDMLKKRSSFNDNDFTLESLERFIESLGVDEYEIAENPSGNNIAVRFEGSYSDAEANWIIRQIKDFLPAHLLSVVFLDD